MLKLHEWWQVREANFGQEALQSLSVGIYVYQEDILARAIGTKEAHQIDKGLPILLENRNGKSWTLRQTPSYISEQRFEKLQAAMK